MLQQVHSILFHILINYLFVPLVFFKVSSVEIGATVNSVRILSVSTLLDTDNSARVGSIEGGTRLYIKMVGHDTTLASNNSIYIGSYPCEIPGNFHHFISLKNSIQPQNVFSIQCKKENRSFFLSHFLINKARIQPSPNFWEFYIQKNL